MTLGAGGQLTPTFTVLVGSRIQACEFAVYTNQKRLAAGAFPQ